MAVFTVSLQQATGVGDISLGDGTTLATLSVSAGRGPKGDGFTGGTYNASTGIVTFTSNDGIGFSTDDLRGDLSEPGPIGDVTPNTGAFTTGTFSGDLTVDTDTLFVDASTNRVGIGTSSNTATFAGVVPRFQIEGGNAANATLSIRRTSSDANGPLILLEKIKGASAVVNGDNLGSFIFTGYDGSDQIRGAQISAEISGAVGTNDLPTDLIFSTTGDGSSTPSEAMRIDSSGNVGIGTSSPGSKLSVVGLPTSSAGLSAGDIYIDAGTLKIVT